MRRFKSYSISFSWEHNSGSLSAGRRYISHIRMGFNHVHAAKCLMWASIHKYPQSFKKNSQEWWQNHNHHRWMNQLRLDKPAVWGSVGRDKTDLSFSPRAAGLVIIFAKSNAWGSTFVCGLNRTELHSTLLQGGKIHSVTKHTYSICIQSVEPV